MDTIAASKIGETISMSYHIWEVSGLVIAIVAMATFIVVQNNKMAKIAKESNIVISKNNAVIENNTKAHEKVFEFLINRKK